MNIEIMNDFENKILEEIDSKISKKSEMTLSERQFLNGIIRRFKPKKVVEIGVAAGSSSAIILNAIKDIEGAHLYSLDYNEKYYRNNKKNTGFILEKFPELSGKWSLLTGGMSCNFLDKIGGDIDVCLLDTVHSNPGEFLDYLQVLPYMKKNGIIILHDTSLHTNALGEIFQTTCCTLYSVINGTKLIPSNTEYKHFPNIGAIVLDDNALKYAFDAFNCLALPWSYMISEEDISQLSKHFEKHYNRELINRFISSIEYNKELFRHGNSVVNKPIDFKKYFEAVNAQKQIDKLAKKYNNKKVVVYGAGQYNKALFDNYDLSKLNIVAVADRAFEDEKNRSFYGLNCVSPCDIKEMDCDIILLGVYDSSVILDYLNNKLLVNCKNSNIKIRKLIKKPLFFNVDDMKK